MNADQVFLLHHKMENSLRCHIKLKWLIKSFFLNVNCLSCLTTTTGSLSTNLSPIITTSHVVQMSAQCTFLMSVGGGAAIIVSSRRSGSSQNGHGLSTSTFTSQTGVPHRSQPTERRRGLSQRRPRFTKRRDPVLGEENALEIDFRHSEAGEHLLWGLLYP